MITISIVYTGEISNIFSLRNAIEYLGYNTMIINHISKINKVEKIAEFLKKYVQ